MKTKNRKPIFYKIILENKIKSSKEFRKALDYPIDISTSDAMFSRVYETIKEYVTSNQTLLNEILEENSYMPNKKVVSDTTTVKNEIPRLFETKNIAKKVEHLTYSP